MNITLYQVDAFTTKPFGGNPAGVCPLDSWPDDALLQSIAMENNLSETAFFVREGNGFHLRWFTPEFEIDLCGHATLATAFILFTELEPGRKDVSFRTQSGTLTVTLREDGLLEMTFPSRPPRACDPPDELLRALGATPREILRARDFMVVFDSEDLVRALKPDMNLLARVDAVGVIVTAEGRNVDFVSRFFAPRAGIPEDPVTGSAHCTLIPYWSRRLGKTRLEARQVSARGGELLCEDRGDSVGIAGRAVKFMEGTIVL